MRIRSYLLRLDSLALGLLHGLLHGSFGLDDESAKSSGVLSARQTRANRVRAALAPRGLPTRRGGTRTFAAAVGSFLVVVLFLTPTGLAPLTTGVFLVLVVLLRVMVGAVSTVAKMRGLELPVAERVPSRGMLEKFQIISLIDG